MDVTTTGPRQDIVAVFNDQGSADGALVQLRLAGVPDDRIGLFSGPNQLTDRQHGFTGAVVGGVVGVLVATAVAPLLAAWGEAVRNVPEEFGLLAILRIVFALFFGLIGWGIGLGFPRAGVAPPPADVRGPYTLVVTPTDADRARIEEIVRHNHGHAAGAAAHAH